MNDSVIRGLALGTLNEKTRNQFLNREIKMETEKVYVDGDPVVVSIGSQVSGELQQKQARLDETREEHTSLAELLINGDEDIPINEADLAMVPFRNTHLTPL